MNVAVISLTENGRGISEKLSEKLNGLHSVTRFCRNEHSDEHSIQFGKLKHLTRKIFDKYDALVFLCAVGITVRVCAPCIISKLSDPAIVSVDDSGKFAVSVLSGHLGGANELTQQIAKITGAVPVITTATDTHNLFSPDMFAKRNGLVICDMDAAKKAASAIVNGEKVGFRCNYPHSVIPKELTEDGDAEVGICVSGNADEKPFKTTLNLLPKNLVVGIGCKKAASADMINKHITNVFSENDIDIRRLSCAATIDIKAGEAGIMRFCEKFGIPLRTFTSDELMSIHGEFSHSDFVMKTTGADNVCERAAVCAGGELIVGKKSGTGVTAAIAELPVYIDLERKDV